jgi:hypothetical protein
MPIEVRVGEQRNDKVTRRTLCISDNNGSALCPDVFFECSGITLPELKLFDFAVLATVFLAMRRGDDLHIRGPVNRRLLRNLEEFQEAWALWCPQRYRPVKISADNETENAEHQRARSAVFAFSGGVDSVFTLIRHHYGLAGRRSCRPVAACLVHGFDIGLDQRDAFDLAQQRAQGIVTQLGLPLVIVRTNWRAHLCDNWEFEFGAALASCLYQFSGLVGTGVSAGGEDYAHLTLPWGSNPITNPLFCSDTFEFITDGDGFTRTEKVRLICNHTAIAENLRVCWEGQRAGHNCGRCEKCIRTKLNFLAFGKEPVCFSDGRPTAWQILTINARNETQRSYLKEIYRTARANRVTDLWVSWLALGIARCYVRAALIRFKAFARLSVKTLAP